MFWDNPFNELLYLLLHYEMPVQLYMYFNRSKFDFLAKPLIFNNSM